MAIRYPAVCMADNRIISSPHNLSAHHIHSAYVANVATIKPKPEGGCAPANMSNTECHLAEKATHMKTDSTKCILITTSSKVLLSLTRALEREVVCWRKGVPSSSCTSNALLTAYLRFSKQKQTTALGLSHFSLLVTTQWWQDLTRNMRKMQKQERRREIEAESGSRERLEEWEGIAVTLSQASTRSAVRMHVASHSHSHRTFCCPGRMSILAWDMQETKTFSFS